MLHALATLRDNPILWRHIRSRLRREHLIPAIAGVVLTAGVLVWIGSLAGALQANIAFMLLTIVQGAVLFIGGTSQVASSVTQARESGIIEFHRISPQTPQQLALGFLVGAPIRELVLFACTLPLSVLLAILNAPGPLAVLLVLGDMMVLSLLFYTLALLVGLASLRARNAANSVVALVMIGNTGMLGWAPALRYLTLFPVYQEAVRGGAVTPWPITFFFAQVPEIILALVHQLPILVFLWIAAVRKMRSERAYFYAKPTAVAFFGTLSVLALGDVAGHSAPSGTMPGSLPVMLAAYPLLGLGIALLSSVTPAAGDYAAGVRRARRRSLPRPPVWWDYAPNWAPMLAMTAILIGTLALAAVMSPGGWSARSIVTAVIATAVLVYFGSAKQAFDLLYRKSSASYLGLLLFAVWFVPLLLATATMIARMPESVGDVLLGVSPWAAIGLAGARPAGNSLPAGAIVGVGSSLLLAAGFLQMRVRAERRAAELATKPLD